MTDREKRQILKLAARWRRIAKRTADALERMKWGTTSLVRTLEPLKHMPVLDGLYLTALRWDCRVGDDLRDLRDEIAAATQQTRKYNPPGQLTLLPA